MLNSDKLDIVEDLNDKSKIQTFDQLFAKHNPAAPQKAGQPSKAGYI